MACLAWACHEIGGIESVRVPFDITVEAEAMGCKTRFGEDLETPPMTTVKTKAEYGGIRIPDPLVHGRMPAVPEAITILREKAGDAVPVIAALGTPFELLSTSLAFEDITESFVSDEPFITGELEKMTEVALRYAAAMEARGPNVLMLVDGTTQSLGRAHFARFSLPFTKTLAASLRTPAILHICGNPAALLPEVAGAGVHAVSIDAPVEAEAAREALGDEMALVGKIAAPRTLLEGDMDRVVDETRSSLREGMDVVAPGCGILPQTPLAHLMAYVDTVKGWKTG